jgi:hypothetical protein
MMHHFLDGFSLGTLFLITLAGMLIFMEFGYRLGARPSPGKVKQQTSQVRGIMGAMLGLTAFMLAFTFASAERHHQARIDLMVAEAGLLSDAFLQAAFLEAPQRTTARRTLHQYTQGRIDIVDAGRHHQVEKVAQLIGVAQALQMDLWQVAVDAERNHPDRSEKYTLLTGQVQGIINMHAARLQAVLLNRVSWIIWLTLFLTGFMGMLVMGYQAGLTGHRSLWATATLALAFSAVMMLIVDLDRPMMNLFHIDNHVMIDLERRMGELLESPGAS